MSWDISDADGSVPRAKRDGLPIPPELLEAVQESLTQDQPKTVSVFTDDDAQYVMKLLRSLANRKEYGYQFKKTIVYDSAGNPSGVQFHTTGRKPEEQHN